MKFWVSQRGSQEDDCHEDENREEKRKDIGDEIFKITGYFYSRNFFCHKIFDLLCVVDNDGDSRKSQHQEHKSEEEILQYIIVNLF